MSKVIVIPSVDYCPFRRFVFTHDEYPDGHDGCELEKFKECPAAGFPCWCPLPDLPEKMLTWHDDEHDDYEMGWNACLDAIRGEEEE